MSFSDRLKIIKVYLTGFRSYIYTLSDLVFGFVKWLSTTVDDELSRRIQGRHCRIGFNCVAPFCGLFFILHPLLFRILSDTMKIFRAFRFPIVGLTAAFWLHMMIPKTLALPKKSELVVMNGALVNEVEVCSLTEEKLFRLNFGLGEIVHRKTNQIQVIIDNSPTSINFNFAQINHPSLLIFPSSQLHYLCGL